MIKRLSVKLWLVVGAIVLGMLLVIGLGFWLAQRSFVPPPEEQSPLANDVQVSQLDGLVTVNIPGAIAVQEPGGKETLVLVDGQTTSLRHGEPDSGKVFEIKDVKAGERVSVMAAPDGEDVRAVTIIVLP